MVGGVQNDSTPPADGASQTQGTGKSATEPVKMVKNMSDLDDKSLKAVLMGMAQKMIDESRKHQEKLKKLNKGQPT